MNKDILRDYVDACELIKETEEDIRRMRRQQTVYDKVRGSNPEFPYQSQSFGLCGAVETTLSWEEVKKSKELLQQRRENARQIKEKVESWMNTIPSRMQRIIRYKIFERLSWEEVANRMGRDATPDSIRMEYHNFMKKRK